MSERESRTSKNLPAAPFCEPGYRTVVKQDGEKATGYANTPEEAERRANEKLDEKLSE